MMIILLCTFQTKFALFGLRTVLMLVTVFLGQINDSLDSEDLSLVSISIPRVRSAFCLLKHHKNDGTDLSSDHLILALPAIELFAADLFTSILRHGYMPAVLHDCILVPIPKGNKDPTLSDNYRPIALA